MAKPSREYWNRRMLRDKARVINNAERYLQREQKRLYSQTAKEIGEEIEKLYETFADQQKITLAEAKRRIRDADFKKLDFDAMVEESLELMKKIREGNLPEEVLKELERQHKLLEDQLAALSKRGQISYLDMRRIEIEKKLLSLYDTEQQNIYDYLQSEYEDSYYRQVYNTQQQVGYGYDFVQPNAAAVDRAILNPYSRENFSKTLYAHCKHFSKDLRDNLTAGLIRGESLDKMARRIQRRMGVALSAAKRLVRTETAYVYEQATKAAYEECGVEWYEYMATLDNKTSEVCRDLDGKRFKVKDAKLGENYPPMHPNCRSTTVCFFPEDEEKRKQDTRIARDENGRTYEVPASMTYREWQKKYGSGIMKAQEAEEIQEDAPKPKLLGSMERTDRQSCLDKLRELEKEIEKQDYETAFVITKDGKLYRIDGESASVNINGMGKKSLRNAYMTHNHPASETRYSFSCFDISEAMRNRFAELRGFDDKYEYSITFRDDTKFEEADVIQHRFTTDFYYQVLDEVMAGAEIDMDLDEYHEINKRMAKEYHYDYSRRPRGEEGSGKA